MNKAAQGKRFSMFIILGVFMAATAMGCAGGPLTTREKGAGIGALGGAAAGGIIGSTVGHPGAGAAIGGVLGLGTGALIGDQLQGQERKQHNQRQLEGQHQEIERLKQEKEYLADYPSSHYPKIPPGHLPPPGKCRIWFPGRPPGHQPPPGDCHILRLEVPPGAHLIYG